MFSTRSAKVQKAYIMNNIRIILPKNTGVGSLSLLQGIFPTQE